MRGFTTDAFNLVANIAKAALEEDSYYVVITLDVNKAFNSAGWSKILETLIKLKGLN